MALLEWRKRSPYKIDAVIVPASAVDEDADDSDLPMYVASFVSNALGSARYIREELPREALIAAHLNKYVGEVNNGGHSQFVGNTGWDEDIRADVREGLATLGLDEAAGIFADLEAFAEVEPERFAHHDGEAHEQDPFFNELDDRFYRPRLNDAIQEASAAWIRTWPWLRAIPDEEYRRGTWKTPDHPLKQARMEAMRRKNKPALIAALLQLRDLLHKDRKDES